MTAAITAVKAANSGMKYDQVGGGVAVQIMNGGGAGVGKVRSKGKDSDKIGMVYSVDPITRARRR
jgi:hypothetical protein